MSPRGARETTGNSGNVGSLLTNNAISNKHSKTSNHNKS